jgi:hypothetical protein
MSLREKFHIPSREEFGDYELKKLKEKFPKEDIDSFMIQLKDLVDSGIYVCLFNIYSNWEEPVPLLSDNTTDIALESSLLVLAYENLNLKPSIFSELIDYNKFYYLFPFLEWIYSMRLERQLESEDVRKIFRSDIGERIVFALDDFDEINETPELTPEFFQKIRKIKWKDRKTKNLYSKLEKALRFFVFKNFGFKEGIFNAKQMELVLFFAGCSTVNEGKEKIDENNVFTAYRTLFKIIKTDISKFID